MVVDGLVCVAAILERLDLVVHHVEVLCLGVKSCHTLALASVPVQGVVVIQTDDGCHV